MVSKGCLTVIIFISSEKKCYNNRESSFILEELERWATSKETLEICEAPKM